MTAQEKSDSPRLSEFNFKHTKLIANSRYGNIFRTLVSNVLKEGEEAIFRVVFISGNILEVTQKKESILYIIDNLIEIFNS